MNALRTIVDDHTARRVGNGELPAEPDMNECVRALYDFDATISVRRVADTFALTIADVLKALNADYYCRACERLADLWHGTKGDGMDGDRPVGFWATKCCEAPFIDARGNAYAGENPDAEARY